MPRLTITHPSDRAKSVIAVAAVTLAVLATTILSAVVNSQLSPYDEAAHFDYVVKVAHGDVLPNVGSLYSDTARKAVSCRGSVGYIEPDVRCDNPLQPNEMPFADVNYVLNYAPIYYSVAAVIGNGIHAITGHAVSLFFGARIASALLYAAGAGLFTAAVIRLGARRCVAIGLPLLIFSLPGMLYQGSTVTPDSMSLLAGSAGLFVLTLKTTWRRRLIVAVVVATIVAMIKANNVPLSTLIVLLAAVFPGTTDNLSGKAQWLALGWKRILWSLGGAVVPVVASFAVNRLRNLSLPAGASADGGIGAYLTTNDSLWKLIIDSARTLAAPLTIASYTEETFLSTAATGVQFLLLGGVALMTVISAFDARGKARTLAFGAFAGMVLSIVFLPTTFYVLSHASGTQGRYAIPLIGLYAGAVALVVKEKWTVLILTVAGLAVWVASNAQLLGVLSFKLQG